MSVVWWAVLGIASDILVALALVYLLCRRDYSAGGSVEWALSRRRRRFWYTLAFALGAAYLSLAPIYLAALIRIFRQRRAMKRRKDEG
jgi:hypothetical protein